MTGPGAQPRSGADERLRPRDARLRRPWAHHARSPSPPSSTRPRGAWSELGGQPEIQASLQLTLGQTYQGLGLLGSGGAPRPRGARGAFEAARRGQRGRGSRARGPGERPPGPRGPRGRGGPLPRGDRRVRPPRRGRLRGGSLLPRGSRHHTTEPGCLDEAEASPRGPRAGRPARARQRGGRDDDQQPRRGARATRGLAKGPRRSTARRSRSSAA